MDQYDKTTREEKLQGRAWYKDAHQWCGLTGLSCGLPLQTVAAIVSILSPRNKWERNKKDAATLITAKLSKADFDSFSVCTFTSNKKRAWDLIDAGTFAPDIVFKGPKTRAFYDNIVHRNSERVTVDTWAYRAARAVELRWRGAITPKVYKTIEQEYQKVAKYVGEKPMDLQAIIWIAIQNHTTNEEAKLKESKNSSGAGSASGLVYA